MSTEVALTHNTRTQTKSVRNGSEKRLLADLYPIPIASKH